MEKLIYKKLSNNYINYIIDEVLDLESFMPNLLSFIIIKLRRISLANGEIN